MASSTRRAGSSPAPVGTRPPAPSRASSTRSSPSSTTWPRPPRPTVSARPRLSASGPPVSSTRPVRSSASRRTSTGSRSRSARPWRPDPASRSSWRTTPTPRPGASSASVPERGTHDLVAVTVGTGIGGGIVHRDRLVRGSYGMAAEFGHLVRVQDGRLCGCGKRGCWEQYASGNALLRKARELAADRRGEAHLLLGLGDGTPEGVTGQHVTAGRARGRPGGARGASDASAPGSAPVWPTSRRCSTRRCSSSAAASPRPASCCSSRRAPPSPVRSSRATTVRTRRSWQPCSATTPGMIGAADLAREGRG